MTVSQIWHASAVSLGGDALVCLGRSGSGKSALCAELISIGATLVADDRVEVHKKGRAVFVRAIPQIAGLIEVRGLGVLKLPHVETARLAHLIDLDVEETERLPPHRFRDVMGVRVPLLHRPVVPNLAPALMLLLKHERSDR